MTDRVALCARLIALRADVVRQLQVMRRNRAPMVYGGLPLEQRAAGWQHETAATIPRPAK